MYGYLTYPHPICWIHASPLRVRPQSRQAVPNCSLVLVLLAPLRLSHPDLGSLPFNHHSPRRPSDADTNPLLSVTTSSAPERLLLSISAQPLNMRTTLLSVGLLAWLVSLVSATALTYKMAANEEACFYANADKQGLKIAFYFAVQSGGSFDINYEVTGPGDKVIMDGEKERQGDFVFTANQIGDYKFCFDNDMSTYQEKFVDFEIAVSAPPWPQCPCGSLGCSSPPSRAFTDSSGPMCRSKMRLAPSYPLSRAHRPNTPTPSRS